MVTINDPRFSIEPSDYRCAACESEVAVEAPFFSAVFFSGEAFRRRSYCPPCFTRPAPDVAGAYASWRSRRPQPQDAPRRLRFDPDLVLEFFRRLGEAGEPPPESAAPPPGGPEAAPATPPAGSLPSEDQRTRLRLVLALLLLRRKLLVFESSGLREGSEWLKLSEKADRARVHLVENPPLADAELESVKAGLGELLQMDL